MLIQFIHFHHLRSDIKISVLEKKTTKKTRDILNKLSFRSLGNVIQGEMV